MNHPHPITDEAFIDAVSRQLDGVADDADRALVDRAIIESASHRELYQKLMLTEASLSWGKRDTAAAAATPRGAAQRTPGVNARTDHGNAPLGRITPIALSIAAALLIGAAAVTIYVFVVSAHRTSNIEHRTSSPPVATLIDATGDVFVNDDFANPGGDYAPGTYAIESGSAQFLLTNRVAVDLAGRTTLVINNAMTASLRHGSATFQCPPGTEGFTVRLPGGVDVIDLGTRFVATVDESNGSTVRVTEGAVAIHRGAGPAVTLVAGAIARVPSDASAPIAVTHLADALHLNLGAANGAPATQTIRGQVWNNLAPLNADVDGIRLADGSPADGVIVRQVASRKNPNDLEGVGYVEALDGVTRSLVYTPAGGSVELTLRGLEPGSVWSIDVYAALADAQYGHRTQRIEANGVVAAVQAFRQLHADGAAQSLVDVVADASGAITIRASDGTIEPAKAAEGIAAVHMLQAVSLQRQPVEPAKSNAPLPRPPRHEDATNTNGSS